MIALALLSAGCATPARQTEALLKDPPAGLRRAVEIPQVPFINQDIGHCGPATLTMVMNWNGRRVSTEEIAAQVYTPGMKGSFQTDMIGAARRNSMMAIPIEGLASLLAEISAGHPVIVFENLAFNWYPQYHYAVVYGFDLDQEKIIMHSGPEAGKRWDMKKFERSWMLGDYWGLVVLPPGELAASASELAHVTAAAALEKLEKTGEAEKSYMAILNRWPNSLASLIGLGNLAFEKKNYKKSVEYLRRAVAAHPESMPAKHNLAIAEKKLNTLRR